MTRTLKILGVDKYKNFVQVHILGGSVELPYKDVPLSLTHENKANFRLQETLSPTDNPSIFNAKYTFIWVS